MSTLDTEYEDLVQLVNTKGWAQFEAMVQKQWGRESEAFHDAIEQAARGDNVHLQDHLRQILAAQREIQKVMQLPHNRIKQLKPHSEAREFVGSRRGGL